MNKLYLWGAIFTAIMIAITYFTIGQAAGENAAGSVSQDTVNQLALLGAVAIAVIAIWVSIKYVRQMQTDTADGELSEEEWDGIREYKNDVPMGWAIMFIALMIWGLWYWTVGYPVNAFSQIGQYNEEVAQKNKEFEAKYANLTPEELNKMGKQVFLAECQICHDSLGYGNGGKAANLHQRIEEKSVKYVINHGSNYKLLGFESPMPDRNGLININTGAPISDEEIDIVSKYVANGFNGAGADVFSGVCSSCHGADGRGIDGVAPNIREFTPKLIKNVLTNGKKGAIGVMPAINRLNDKQKEAVAQYIISLSSKGE